MIYLYAYLSGLVGWITVEALWGDEVDDVGIVFRGFTWPLSLAGALIVGVLTTLAAFSAKLRQGRTRKELPNQTMPPRYR